MMLSARILDTLDEEIVEFPSPTIFNLPEKVLQFGTGVLLRGLPDYFIDKANKMGVFNGRIVVVKSTIGGDIQEMNEQNGLYTIWVKGLTNGMKKEEIIINAAVSRVLSAAAEWQDILACAESTDMQVIISNTTEVGIQFIPETIHSSPPVSFPGKLLAFLYRRFQVLGGTSESGMVIVPTELIPDNGDTLRKIVTELAEINKLEKAFIEWLNSSNYFCNSLVDRIVPGKPDSLMQSSISKRLGYADRMLITTEFYRLWAIEGDEKVKAILSFHHADSGVRIEPNIDGYRELKLRLLNGTHTLSCALAFLAGFDTVQDAMANERMHSFISKVMTEEIAPAIPYGIGISEAREYSITVLDRFANPEIMHPWINISMQYSTKMKMRCIPVLIKHYQVYGTVPKLFALGFAAYLFFMRASGKEGSNYYGRVNGKQYLIRDDLACVFYERWRSGDTRSIINLTLADAFWGLSIADLPGFGNTLNDYLEAMMSIGVKEFLNNFPL